MARLYKGEKIIRVVTPLGLSLGQFIATQSDLPLLAEVNHSPRGSVYFRWYAMRPEDCR